MLAEISQPVPSPALPRRDKGKRRADPGPYPTPPTSGSDPGSISPLSIENKTRFASDSSTPLYPSPSISSRKLTINKAALRYNPSFTSSLDIPGSSQTYTLDEDGFEHTGGFENLAIRYSHDIEVFVQHPAKPKKPQKESFSTLPEDPRNLPFELVYIAPKGFGLRSTRHFLQGDIIIEESPFFECTTETKHLLEEFALSEDPTADHLRILLLSFTATIPDIDDVYLNILETNCLTCSVDVDDDGNENSQESRENGEAVNGNRRRRPVKLGLFRYISRLSHSCCPNSGWRWDESSHQYVLRAFANIAPGEEITASYLPRDMLTASRADRMSHLNTNFGFNCACLECSPPAPASTPGIAAASALAHRLRTLEWQEDMRSKEILRQQYRELKEEWEPALLGGEHLEHYVAYDSVSALDRIDESLRILERLDLFACQQDPLSVRFAIHAGCKERSTARKAADALAQFYKRRDGMVAAMEDEHVHWRMNPVGSRFWGACLNPNDSHEDQDSDYQGSEGGKKEEEVDNKDRPARKRRRTARQR